MNKQFNTGVHSECTNFDAERNQCRLMANSKTALCLLALQPHDKCAIGEFRPIGSELELSEPEERIGIRQFAKLVGVKHPSITEAIDKERIPADCVVSVKGSRKLLKSKALDAWYKVHDTSNNAVQTEPEDSIQTDPDDGINWVRRKTKFEALVAEEKHRELQHKNLVEEEKLHYAEDVEAIISVLFANVRTRVLAIASTVAPIIAALPDRSPAKVMEVVEKYVYDALTELSQYDKSAIVNNRKKRTGK